MTPMLRLAVPDDAAQMLEIYGPFCEHTHVSFELQAPSLEEMQARIARITERFPWLVCESEGEILGYAYASPHRERAAYQWAVDVAVYVREGRRRMGIGRAVYTALFAILALQGFYNAYAGIAQPNPGSVGLHESLGFLPVGVYRRVGYKQGAWHDVGWWQLRLQERDGPPAEPVSVRTIQGTAAWEAALRSGQSLLRPPE